MQKKHLFNYLPTLVAVTALLFTSCSKEKSSSSNNESDGTSQYIVAVSPSSDAADILLYTDELSSDLTTIKNGYETGLISAQWYFYNDQRVFGFKYSDGDPTPMETYVLNGSQPVLGNTYSSYRFTTYGTWGDYVITSSSNSYTSKSTNIFDKYFDTEVFPRYMQVARYKSESGTVETYDFEADNYLGTGEYVNMAGFAESDNKLYVSVYPMGATAYGTTKYTSSFQKESTSYYKDSNKYLDYESTGWGGTNSGSFKPGEIPTTPYPDQFHIAIFEKESDFPNNPTLIKDDRMSPACGRLQSAQYPTIMADSSENVYIFSPGNERSYTTGYQLYNTVNKLEGEEIDHTSTDGLLYRAKGTHKASVMRINKGQTSLDESYGVVDIESLIDNRSFLCTHHISNDRFLIRANNEPNSPYTTAYKFYIFNAESKTAGAVTGLPEYGTISSVSRNPLFEDGYAYIGITSSDNSYPAIYKINSQTYEATKVLEIQCYSIHSIGKLSSK